MHLQRKFQTMTNRERVLCSLKHRQPDKVPYCITFTKLAYDRMAHYYGDPDFANKLGNCFTLLTSEPANGWREIRPNIWEDQFGILWDRSIDKDIGVPINKPVTKENVTNFPFPDPDDPSRYFRYTEALTGNLDSFFVVDLGWTLFERAWTLFGMENFLRAMITDKESAHTLLDRITEWNVRMIDNICSFDIDAVWFGDDWGHQRGLIMGPSLWNEFIKSRIAKLFRRVKERGKYVFIHSCGKVDELFPDLIECELDVFNPFQPEVMDIFQLKKKYGGKLSFWGGISTQRTLPNASVEAVKEEVRSQINEIGKNGGYIAAPAHDIPPDARPENIVAMIEVLQSQ